MNLNGCPQTSTGNVQCAVPSNSGFGGLLAQPTLLLSRLPSALGLRGRRRAPGTPCAELFVSVTCSPKSVLLAAPWGARGDPGDHFTWNVEVTDSAQGYFIHEEGTGPCVRGCVQADLTPLQLPFCTAVCGEFPSMSGGRPLKPHAEPAAARSRRHSVPCSRRHSVHATGGSRKPRHGGSQGLCGCTVTALTPLTPPACASRMRQN